MSTTIEERFQARIKPANDGSGCIVWTPATHKGLAENTYGQLGVNGKTIYVHRYSYQRTYGAIPPGYQIDHMCHNRLCVNPNHLQAVTHKVNQENRKGARKDTSSGYRGVHWSKRARKWVVKVGHNGKCHYGGVYANKDEAAAAARELRNRLYTNNLRDRMITPVK